LSYDNYGNRYTGKERANVVVDINNPSKFGDKISFIKTINSSTNYDFTKILYEFPIQQPALIRMSDLG
jgi:hemolysin activation/secretion protein